MPLRRSIRIGSLSTTLPTNNIDASATNRMVATVSRKRQSEPTTLNQTKKKLKTASIGSETLSVIKNPEGPRTAAKVKAKRSARLPLLTPTPSLVGVIRAPYSTGDIDDATPPPPPPPDSRLVDPHVTNATLVTPSGGQATAFPKSLSNGDADISRTKQLITTSTLLEKAQAHLIDVDPRFAQVIPLHRCAIFSPEGLAETIDPFRSLTSGICGQQVSGAAAKAIKNKFVALYNEDVEGIHIWPTPNQVAETKIEKLRTAGLSQRKAEYIQGLAKQFVTGELSTQMLLQASDEEVMEKLIAVRGLGKWSVEMFACFGLKRIDILSTGDLGVQRGMASWFGKDIAKLKSKGGGKWKYMTEKEMLEKSEPFAPYRSLFMWYMWRVADVDTSVLKA